jgi:uncharacterized membrane protein YqjE
MGNGAILQTRQGGPDGRSLGGIVQDILLDIQNVLRAELRLARVEVAEKARRAASAGGLLGGALVAALLGAGSLVAAVIAALALVLPVWAAALIVTALLLGGAGLCYALGRARLRHLNPVPERTVRTVKDDIEWVKQRSR